MTAPQFRVVPALHGILFDRAGDFAALRDAEDFLREAGFSVGSIQRGLPTAVMYGDYSIAKWRNLDAEERQATHATLSGDNRNGPLTFRLLPAAPKEAVVALARATGELE